MSHSRGRSGLVGRGGLVGLTWHSRIRGRGLFGTALFAKWPDTYACGEPYSKAHPTSCFGLGPGREPWKQNPCPKCREIWLELESRSNP